MLFSLKVLYASLSFYWMIIHADWFYVFSWCLFQNMLPFCMREVWVITACLALISATTTNHSNEPVAQEKEFCRLQGDLYSLCRIKVNIACHTSDFLNSVFSVISSIRCISITWSIGASKTFSNWELSFKEKKFPSLFLRARDLSTYADIVFEPLIAWKSLIISAAHLIAFISFPFSLCTLIKNLWNAFCICSFLFTLSILKLMLMSMYYPMWQLMRLAYLIGYGSDIERSPVNR